MNARRIALTLGLCMLLFQGTAYGIIGVDDNVPAQELIFPFICEGHMDADGHAVFGSLNTLWAFAETEGLDTRAYVMARSRKGEAIVDFERLLTPRDVDVGDCQSMIMFTPPHGAQKLLTTIGGKDYFVGYLSISNSAGKQNLIGWVTLADISKWTAANFKPYQAEFGADPATFAEGMGSGPIYADKYFLRYLLVNDLSETSNWWIVLRGQEYCDSRPAGACVSEARLTGIVCNEDEMCMSVAIPVPDRLTIINVADILPGSMVYPKAGFGSFGLVETGLDLFPYTPFVNEDFTAFMWSYQRQQNISTIPYPVDPRKLDKLDRKYGTINDSNIFSLIDPADRRRR